MLTCHIIDAPFCNPILRGAPAIIRNYEAIREPDGSEYGFHLDLELLDGTRIMLPAASVKLVKE